MKIVTVEEMQQIERCCMERGTSLDDLIEAAGLAAALAIENMIVDIQSTRILVLVGPGHNGSDGLVAARILRNMGAMVTVYLCLARPKQDSKLAIADTTGCTIIDGAKDSRRKALDNVLANSNLVVDAVLGIGRNRPVDGPLREIFSHTRKMNQPGVKPLLIALDLPSGLDADSGVVDPSCLIADYTITFGYPKIGLLTTTAASYVGTIHIADIGLPPDLEDQLPVTLLDPNAVANMLPKRPLDAHKGSFGHVLVVGGSRQYIGAPYLACMGAYRCGAGRVTLATPETLYPILGSKLTETTHMPLPEATPGVIHPDAAHLIIDRLLDFQAIVIGCGLSEQPAISEFVKRLLLEQPLPVPVVIDADALNHISKEVNWWEHFRGQAILTPHPKEMSRLLARDTTYVQENRLQAAKQGASLWNQTVVLKGAFTTIATADGTSYINPHANPGLASAGTGDVLAGVIGGLLAQGIPAGEAAAAGVYIHSAAGESLKETIGDAGMIASDLLAVLPRVIRDLKKDAPTR